MALPDAAFEMPVAMHVNIMSHRGVEARLVRLARLDESRESRLVSTRPSQRR